MKILGIDEAGRGPVIGSMFIGGFMAVEEDLPQLEELGVKDSKKLSDSRRDRMDEVLEDIGEVFLKEVTASQIDELREVMSLNEIELQSFAEVVEKADPDKVYLDLPEPDAERFVRKVKKELPPSFEDVEFVAEHGADEEYDIVSAASIAAKSARERHVKDLKEKYGYDFKSGYPHDQPTIEFLEKYVEQNGELPPETRNSWSTAERILKENQQSSVSDF
jgi:ribonuclease H, mammalian HI/archaeal HII subfamily